MSLAATLLQTAALKVHETFTVEHLPIEGQGLRPMRRVGGADLKSVLEDFRHSLAYLRWTAPMTMVPDKAYAGCSDAYRRTYSARIVVLAKREDPICSDLNGALTQAMENIMAADGALRTLTGADIVYVSRSAVDADSYRTAQSEAPGFELKLQWAMGYLDITIEATGEAGCFINC